MTGQKLTTPKSRNGSLTARLLSLAVGEYFLLPVSRRSSVAPTMVRLAKRTGRRWTARAMLRLDGNVQNLRVSRTA